MAQARCSSMLDFIKTESLNATTLLFTYTTEPDMTPMDKFTQAAANGKVEA